MFSRELRAFRLILPRARQLDALVGQQARARAGLAVPLPLTPSEPESYMQHDRNARSDGKTGLTRAVER